MFQFSFNRPLSTWQRFGLGVLCGLGITLFLWVSQGQASEMVLLQNRDLKVQIPFADLQAFAADQETSPAIQQFLDDTDQNPAEVQQWLTTPLRPSPLTKGISPDFILIQINKTLGDPLGRENLTPLKTAFEKSLNESREFTILQLIENYPEPSVRLELSRLERVYSDVELLVTRIEPILQLAKDFFPALDCNCTPVESSANRQGTLGAIAVSQPSTQLTHPKTWKSDNETVGTQSTSENLRIALEPSDSPALTNKNLVFQFGPFGRSIPMADLTRFAETGELSSGWQFFFNVAGVDSEAVRAALNEEISVELGFLDRTLNGLLGEFLLYQISQVVHTPSNTTNIQALRAATILSVAEDNRLSLLELLQQYPTQEVHINGTRLARIGQSASRFQSSGGVRTAVVSLEDWLVQLQASAVEHRCACPEGETAALAYPTAVTTPSISKEDVAAFLPPNWQPVASHREDHGSIKVIWQQGTPYEMGYQHGQLLHDEIASLGPDVLGALRFAGRGLALSYVSTQRSFPDVIEECRGLTAATEDIGMTTDACLVFAYGDVFQELFGNTLPNMLFWNGCSQWVAAGEATVDGRIYHGSTLDNDTAPIDYIMNNPVVFVRQPEEGLPHIFITYPGVVWPNWGLNVAGITLGLDSLKPRSADELVLDGYSEVQIMAQILRTATNFTEVREMFEGYPSARANLIMATDGKSKDAAVFEVVGNNVGVRELQENGVLYVTNHALMENVFEQQQKPLNDSTLRRFERFGQLMEPDGISTLYGTIDSAVMAQIGRDRTHPETLEPSPFEVFDDDASPGGNGSLRQGIYDPERLLLWVAAGQPPVPENPFVCFSLGEMLGFPNATPCASPSL